MMKFNIAVVLATMFTTYVHSEDTQPRTERPGHMDKFGTGPSFDIQEMQGFPNIHAFFNDYLLKSVPLKMSGAIRDTDAYRKWSDDYFLSLKTPADYRVLVETEKKENRKQDTLSLPFHEFVRTYNDSERYMVQTVPPFIQGDFPLPSPLQCEELYDNFISDAIMWYSSGGTKSVVHTDSLENINCVVRGDKQFVMVDPHKYGKQVDIDRKEGAYSSMDVDRVDFDKFPGMEGVEFYHVNLKPGDCLYIPYKWIHQVRSYGRNIAVNLWWDHYASLKLDLSLCQNDPDPHLTLDKVTIKAKDTPGVEEAKDFMMSLVEDGPATFDVLHDSVIGDLPIAELDVGGGYMKPMLHIMDIVDLNQDGLMSAEEVEQVTDEDWEEVIGLMEDFNEILDAFEGRWAEVEGQGDETGDFHYDDMEYDDMEYAYERDEL